MESAGAWGTVLLRSDGQAIIGNYGNCRIPPLDEGISYVQVSAGTSHIVLLRSDGQAVACRCVRYQSERDDPCCKIPPLEEGISYTQVSAGSDLTVLLRSDGQAVACEGSPLDHDRRPCCTIPPLDEGISYTHVSAGGTWRSEGGPLAVLLRSDGQVVACGQVRDWQCRIPPLDEGISYIQVSAGRTHIVLLRSDGQAVACGKNENGKLCRIPRLDEGISYTQVSAGGVHTVLLRSDGQAVACEVSDDQHGPRECCRIPLLDEGVFYTHVSAGGAHTVLLRSDGQAVVCGDPDPFLECGVIPLEPGHHYVAYQYRVLQLEFAYEDDGVILTCFGLDGHEVLRLNAQKSDKAADICMRVARESNTSRQRLKILLPDGMLFDSICRANPFAQLSDVIGKR